MRQDRLRRGDLVDVRGAAEILGTLDDAGALDAMPFMPEMVRYCGRRFTVDGRAEKVCDTYTNYGESRRLFNAVLLDDLRCDGSGHGGCQAECRFYWNEMWLRRADPGDPTVGDTDDGATAALLRLVEQNTQRPAEGSALRYRCQATEMGAASVALSTSDPRPYVRELTSGNVSVRTFARVMSRATVMQPLHRLGRMPTLPLKGPSAKSPKAGFLDLQPGEWVRVKSREQIRETLTDKGANRGLYFDREMMAFCGKVFRVHARVTQIIDERSGEMINLASDCIMLENGVCSGQLSTGRWFCPREIYSYFRECWLERVDAPSNGQRPTGA
jgi:hypothetical protein